MGPEANTALVDDGRFLVVFDFTPGTAISVFDMTTLSRVSMIETPGCYTVFPTGKRGVSMLCGDGRLLTVHLDAKGGLARTITSEPFFDPDVDPIMENGVGIRGIWYFPGQGGDVYPVDLSGEEPVFDEPWPLDNTTGTEGSGDEGEAWLPGGPVQLAATNALRGELFVMMHPSSMASEGDATATHPGTEVWVYDPATQSRIRRMVLNHMANTIYVTPDEQPLLVTTAVDPELYIATEDGTVGRMLQTIEIYDAVSGEYLRNYHDASYLILSINGAPASGNNGGAQ